MKDRVQGELWKEVTGRASEQQGVPAAHCQPVFSLPRHLASAHWKASRHCGGRDKWNMCSTCYSNGVVGSKEEVTWVCCMSLGDSSTRLSVQVAGEFESHWWNSLWISILSPHPALSNLRSSPGIRVGSMVNNAWVFIHRWFRSGRYNVWPSGEGGWWFYITARVHSKQEADRERGGAGLLCLQLACCKNY